MQSFAYIFFGFAFIFGAGSYMFLRLRLPYLAPRELLQGLQAATKLSNPFTPGVSAGQRSTSIRWSAVVASRRLHQWHSGLSLSIMRRFVLNCVWLRVCAFSVRLRCWVLLWVLRCLGISHAPTACASARWRACFRLW